MNLKHDWRQFLQSFKTLDKDYLRVLLYDFLFLTIFILSFLAWNTALNMQAAKLPDVETATIAQAEDVLSGFKGFLFSIVIFSLLWFMVLIVSSSFFKGLAWSRILKKRYDSDVFKNLFLSNMFLIPIYAIMIIIVFSISGKIFINAIAITSMPAWIMLTLFFFVIIMPIIFYLIESINIIHMKIIEKGRILNGLREGIRTSVSPKLYLPYVFSSILLIMISIIIYPFGSIRNMLLILSLAIFLLFSTWLKFYIKDTLMAKHKAKK